MDEHDLAETRAAFVAALRSGDAQAAAAVYARDARLLAPSAELIEGRDAIEAFWRTGIEAGVSAVDLDVLELERHDGRAYEFGRYVLRVEPADGTPVVDRGTYLLVHALQPDGSWCWSVEALTPDLRDARAAPADRGAGDQRGD